jgi:hypothetical protein
VLACIGAAAAALLAAYLARRNNEIVQPAADLSGSRECDRMFATITITALAIAVVLSPWSNLVIGRVTASLLPLLILVFASWISRTLFPAHPRSSPLAAALLGFVVVAWTIALIPAVRNPRSNFRDLASVLNREKQPDDLLVLAAELYAPVFNRYFDESIEQVDFPNSARTRVVGFANLYERAADSVPLGDLRRRVIEAESSGRRLWLLSSTRVTRPDSSELAAGVRQKNARILWRLRIAQVQELVGSAYGPPDSTFSPHATTARYDRLKLELYRAD